MKRIIKLCRSVKNYLKESDIKLTFIESETNHELHETGISLWQLLRKVILPALVIILTIILIRKYR